MDNDIYVLSLRSINKSPAQCCVIEFEDVMIKCLGAELIKPSHVIENASSKPRTLFVVGLSIYDVDAALRSIKPSIDAFDKVCAYVFDAFLPKSEFKKPVWRKLISTHYRTIRKVSHLFVPFRQSVKEFEQCFNIPVSYMPLAVDVFQHGGYDEHKIIDVNGYGRQYGELEKMLSVRFNQRGSHKVFHHTNHAHMPIIHDAHAHRRLFWQQLRKSRIAMAFDPMHTDLNGRFRFSFVGQRWFESAAAGCVIVGKRPVCAEMDELFNWQDSTIELPDDAVAMADSIEHMLSNWNLDEIGKRNYAHCLDRHDWRHRIRDMLEIMQTVPSKRLIDEIEELSKNGQRYFKDAENGSMITKTAFAK
jgi:hypothetical protein